jgi:hypothetical protein
MTHTTPNLGDFQLEFCLRGLSSVRENLSLTYAELKARAHPALPPDIMSYVAGEVGNEYTQEANVTAFDRWGPMLLEESPDDGTDRGLAVFFGCADLELRFEFVQRVDQRPQVPGTGT